MLLTALVVLAGVVGALLIAPWRIDLYLHKPAESAQVRVRAHLRWIVFGWWIDGRGARARRASPPKPVARRSPGRGLAAVRAALATPGFVARVGRLIRAVGRQAWPRTVAVRARVGFDDPADTGMFLATCYGVASAVPHPGWTVQVAPDFTGEALDGDAHVQWSVRLIAVVWPAVTFMASPVVWRGMRSAVRARRV